MEEIIIVGAMHGATDFITGNYTPVKPSNGSLNLLKKLKKNSAVAVEIEPITKEYAEFLETMYEKGIAEEGNDYFKKIAAEANNLGLKVIHLENEDLTIRKLEFYRKFRESKDINHFFDFFKIYAVEREQFEEEQIKNFSPALSFVGFAHANRWFFDNKFNGNTRFFADVTASYMHGESLLDESPVFSRGLYDSTLNIHKLLNLFYKGSFSEDKPDYIGTWNLNNPALGRFEMFFSNSPSKESKIATGRIDDLLGSAYFEGSFEADSIRFIKIYNEESIVGAKGVIDYECKKTPDSPKDQSLFKGVYSGDGLEGNFILAKEDLLVKPVPQNFIFAMEQLMDIISTYRYDSARLKVLMEQEFHTRFPNSNTENLDDLPF